MTGRVAAEAGPGQWPQWAVLGLLDPSAQGLGNTADLGCNGRDRARLRFVGALMLEHHSDRASADLRRVAICHFAFCHNHHRYLS